ncbi:MAG: hypothetical protein QOG42_518 [Solirubrobacteraceae bacterium]|nr:hypothetical protein [Solirubrobacteraceae bacterium]
MAPASRSLLVAVVIAFALVAGWLLVGQPQPQPPARSHTPFAPLQAVQQAKDVSAASDAANAQLQAAGDRAAAP